MILGPLSNIIDFINNLFNDFGTTIAEIGKTAKEFYNNEKREIYEILNEYK